MARTMSDPVTNVEIEDVLSSIRRLVSEEARPRRVPEVEAPERLVLSPALRVADEHDMGAADPVVTEPDDGGPTAVEPPIVLTSLVEPEPEPEPEPEFEPEATLAEVESAGDVTEPDRGLSDAVQQGSLVLEPENRADPDEDDADLDVDFGAEATLAEEDDAILLSQATADDTDLPEDPAPEDYAEAEQLAALRASLTDILAPAQEVVNPTDTTSDDDHTGAEDADLSIPESEAEIAAGDDTLERKIATLENLLHLQSHGVGYAHTDVPEPESRDTFEAFEAERDAPDSAIDPALTDEVSFAELVDEALSLQEGEGAPEGTETTTVEASDSPDGFGVPGESPEPENTAVAADKIPVDEAEDVDAVVDETTLSDAMDTSTPDTSTVEEDLQAADEAEPEVAGAAFLRHATAQPLDWEDHVPGAGDMPGAQADPLAERDPAAVPADLDDEALQALVANLVRQELQGALGERITRNVRKLVRREIHRVLMSKEFD